MIQEQYDNAYYQNKNKFDVVAGKTTAAHKIYQNTITDAKIYFYFKGRSAQKTHFLYKNGAQVIFNKGWLWEWFNAWYYNADNSEKEMFKKEVEQNNISRIIGVTDYIRGTKEGDFRTRMGQELQAKYDNARIISFNSIRLIIHELRLSLEQLQQEQIDSASQATTLRKVLDDYFIPETTELVTQEVYNNVNKFISWVQGSK